jgi:hypothetical protein
LVTGLAHTLQIYLRFRDPPRELKAIPVAGCAGNPASERGDLLAEHGIGQDG